MMLKFALNRMDCLKWQLRKDLTGRYHTIDLKASTERAKGWNACRDYILKFCNSPKNRFYIFIG